MREPLAQFLSAWDYYKSWSHPGVDTIGDLLRMRKAHKIRGLVEKHSFILSDFNIQADKMASSTRYRDNVLKKLDER